MTKPYAYNGLSLLVFVVFCFSLVACGGSSSETSSTSIGSTQRVPTGDYDSDDYAGASHDDGDNDDRVPKDRDNDSDNSSGSYYDRDDDVARDFGHPADATDKQAITALVKRYYHAAVGEDGLAACSMTAPSLANSVPEDLGRPPGPSYLRGTTCGAVMSRVFKKNIRQLSAYDAELEITGVRVDGSHGLVVLGFRTLPGRQIGLGLEGHQWKLEELLDSELP